MNKSILKSKMALFEDTAETLATAIGIANSTLSVKMNSYNGAEFTQGEIRKIKDRYDLTAEEVDLIFFAAEVS